MQYLKSYELTGRWELRTFMNRLVLYIEVKYFINYFDHRTNQLHHIDEWIVFRAAKPSELPMIKLK